MYVLKGAPKALDEYRPLLKVTEDEYTRLKYKFVTIPNGPGTLFLLIGAAMGAGAGFSDMAVAPAVDYAFPQLRIAIWMLGSGGDVSIRLPSDPSIAADWRVLRHDRAHRSFQPAPPLWLFQVHRSPWDNVLHLHGSVHSRPN